MRIKVLFSSLILSLSLCACGSSSPSISSILSSSLPISSETSSEVPSSESSISSMIPSSSKEVTNPADVFVLLGQSNMEGNTTYVNFPKYCTAKGLNKEIYYNGFEKINISFHNHYNKEYNNSSNPSSPNDYNFIPVKLGQGGETKYFGPEVGMAERLSEQELDKPLYLVKYCSGGTGFSTQTRDGISDWDWQSPSSTKSPGKLYTGAVKYIKNCMAGIKEQGYTPILKGVLWMQGERDGCFESFSKSYYRFLANFVNDLRDDLEEFAENEFKLNIAFIDAYIYEGPSEWIYYENINSAKLKFHNKDSNSFLLDTTATGLNLTIQSDDGFGGGDQYHFNISSMMELGRGFADIIIDNELI